jgi:hypothetical protein
MLLQAGDFSLTTAIIVRQTATRQRSAGGLEGEPTEEEVIMEGEATPAIRDEVDMLDEDSIEEATTTKATPTTGAEEASHLLKTEVVGEPIEGAVDAVHRLLLPQQTGWYRIAEEVMISVAQR